MDFACINILWGEMIHSSENANNNLLHPPPPPFFLTKTHSLFIFCAFYSDPFQVIKLMHKQFKNSHNVSKRAHICIDTHEKVFMSNNILCYIYA